MTTKSEMKYRETLKLFLWSTGVTALSAFLIYGGFYWFHSIAMIAIGGVLGPIAALVALFMGLMVVAARIEMKK